MAHKESAAGRKAAPQRLAPWFWGAIIAMACATAGLGVFSVLRSSSEAPIGEGAAQSALPAGEWLPAQLKERLGQANHQALAQAQDAIDPLLDAVYQPAYSAIAQYADFHYSVYGEYAELSAAALGDVGAQLQRMVFAGFDDRLAQAAEQLNGVFATAFAHSLTEPLAPSHALDGALGAHTRAALDQTKARMVVTASVTTAAVLGAKAMSAAIAKAMAKKVAAKLAVKAAAKAGGKLAAASAGAGTGGLLCAWAGPGAGLCAAAGGVGAWLVADYGMVKLDEFWNRQEFEADLRSMLDAQKAEHRQLLAQALEARALQVQTASSQTVQTYDFHVRELYGGGNAKVCAAAADVAARYAQLRGDLLARTPAALQALREQALAQQATLALAPMMEEVVRNLAVADQLVLQSVQVSGNVPPAYRADRGLTLTLKIDGKTQPVVQLQGHKVQDFRAAWLPETARPIDTRTQLSVRLEQQFLLLPNKVFAASGAIDPLVATRVAGLETDDGVWQVQTALQWLPVGDVLEPSAHQTVSADSAVPALVALTQFRLAHLPELVQLPDCH